ncbi:helicase-associated domain-containing protein, partial [Kitasatospora nipponensis]|uniref:helicase-associated domain-containing protein n=1 Tax=Kitasatospora nipponensis TaxID=258049 RepID=UPI0031D1B64C
RAHAGPARGPQVLGAPGRAGRLQPGQPQPGQVQPGQVQPGQVQPGRPVQGGDDPAAGGQAVMTEAYDAWVQQPPARQLIALTLAWWALPFTPTASRDAEGKAWPALVGRPPSPSCRQARRGLLTAAGRLPQGRGTARSTGLAALTAWHRPLADQLAQDGDSPFGTVIREAELLGIIARGTLSPLGAALAAQSADQPDALARCATRLLPPATERARLGTDLTAVVPGAPSGRLAGLLDLAADRESRGMASVWRFTPASVRRALDAGYTPQALAADLAAISATGGPGPRAGGGPGGDTGRGQLPQPLAYLITDTARRHGRIRVLTPGCVLHGADPALLAEVAVHRRLAVLRLRQLAPTVLVSAADPAATLAALRAEGYAPVEEDVDGTVRIERTGADRAPALPRPRGAVAGPVRSGQSPAELRALAGRLLARTAGPGRRQGSDEAPEALIAHDARQLSPTDVRRLAYAVRACEPVVIEYEATSGARTVRTISDLELDPPHLFAWCHLRDDQRVFALARIHSVQPH